MQLTQTNENSSQLNIVSHVFRMAAPTKQLETKLGQNPSVYLDDGNALHRFEYRSNCRVLPNANHLLKVSYYAEDGTRIVYSYDTLELSDIVNFYGFELTKTKVEEPSVWNLALQEITSNELHELMTFFRKVWAERMMIDSFDEDFCILEPNAIADYENIIYSLDAVSHASRSDKQQALLGAYLFCIYKSYYQMIRDGKANVTQHRLIIGEIERLLIKLEYRNNYLASLLRKYCHVASLNKSHDITEFPVETQLMWDLYHHFQPALDRKAEQVRLRQQRGFW
jgi:hypothetical protein